jgi:hypothetical protein
MATVSSSYTAVAAVKRQSEISYAATAALKRLPQVSYTARAALLKLASTTYTARASIKGTQTIAYGAVAAIAREFYKNLVIGGLELATVQNTVNVLYGGGASALEATNNGKRVGYRSSAVAKEIQAGVMPWLDADAIMVKNVLGLDGIFPLQLPNGTVYAVRPPEDGQQFQGWRTLGNDRYRGAWYPQPTVLLADLCLRCEYPGKYAFTSGINPVYSYLGFPSGIILTKDVGWRLTGNGSWSQVFIGERTWTSEQRNHMTLVADVSVEAGASAAIGLGELFAVNSKAARPFGGDGLGVTFTGTTVQLLDADDNPIVGFAPAPFVGRYHVIITARPFGGRIEVWRGTTQLLVHRSVPWQPGAVPAGAIFNVRSGSATLHRWWLVRN